MIITWTCKFCGWNNDNNNGPCHNCAGHTEFRQIGGKWQEVTLQDPKPARERLSNKLRQK